MTSPFPSLRLNPHLSPDSGLPDWLSVDMNPQDALWTLHTPRPDLLGASSRVELEMALWALHTQPRRSFYRAKLPDRNTPCIISRALPPSDPRFLPDFSDEKSLRAFLDSACENHNHSSAEKHETEKTDVLPESFPCLPAPVRNRAVLFVSRNLQIGGDHKFHVDLMREFRKEGQPVVAAAFDSSNANFAASFEEACDDLYLAGDRVPLFWLPAWMSWLIQRHGVTTIISTDTALFLQITPYLRVQHPHVQMVDVSHLREPQRPLDDNPSLTCRYASRLDLILTCSDNLRNWFLSKKVEKDKVQTLHLFIDTDWWNPDRADVARMKRQLKLPESALHLVCSCRLEPVKRPMLLLLLLRDLKEEFPDLVLTLAGSGSEQPRLEEAISSFGLQNHVRLPGSMSPEEIRDLLSTATLFVLPSRNEGIALCVYEAMAMGVPVITSAVGGQKELVLPETGILIPGVKQDMKLYHQAIRTLLSSPADRTALARAAWNHVHKHHCVSLIWARFKQLLAESARRSVRTTLSPESAQQARSETLTALQSHREKANLPAYHPNKKSVLRFLHQHLRHRNPSQNKS